MKKPMYHSDKIETLKNKINTLLERLVIINNLQLHIAFVPEDSFRNNKSFSYTYSNYTMKTTVSAFLAVLTIEQLFNELVNFDPQDAAPSELEVAGGICIAEILQNELHEALEISEEDSEEDTSAVTTYALESLAVALGYSSSRDFFNCDLIKYVWPDSEFLFNAANKAFSSHTLENLVVSSIMNKFTGTRNKLLSMLNTSSNNINGNDDICDEDKILIEKIINNPDVQKKLLDTLSSKQKDHILIYEKQHSAKKFSDKLVEIINSINELKNYTDIFDVDMTLQMGKLSSRVHNNLKEYINTNRLANLSIERDSNTEIIQINIR